LDLIISSQELYTLIKSQDNILIIDTRSFLEYKNGHIPGAVNIDLFQLHWFDTTKRGIKDFNRQCKLMLSNLGIRQDNKVIFYENVSGITASRGVWMLMYFSQKNVRMLDGGFEKWKRQKLPIEIKSNELRNFRFRGEPDSNIIADAIEVNKSINKKNVIIVDARSIEEYIGSDVRAARRGHIPSSINIDWSRNITNGVFKSQNKLSKIYSKIPMNSQVITYCQGGYRAAHTFVALKMLGYQKVKMYLGSWGEWGNRLEFQVEC
jgi:thiosulfate/3-mercaptopyruvate sulfurtransferase